MLENMKHNLKKLGMVFVLVLLVGGCMWGYGVQKSNEVPELTTFVDSTGTIEVQEEEVPLAKPKVTTKKTTTTKKKTVKLKKKSKKTYSKKKSTKTTTTKTTTKGNTTTKVEKKVVTKVTENFKKNSKKKTVTTKTTTTVKTTVAAVEAEQENSVVSVQNETPNDVKDKEQNDGAHYIDDSAKKEETKSEKEPEKKKESEKKKVHDVSIENSAPLADAEVIDAYKTLGFTVTINPSVSYAGYFNARNQSIILREDDDTIYHELGHFLAFIAGNVDNKDAFKKVFNEEKGAYKGINKAYVTQSSAEYFAESYRDYVLNPEALQESRPKTYESIKNALSKVTDSWIQTIKMAYAPVWK